MNEPHISTFRHQPEKSILRGGKEFPEYNWKAEPVVTRHRIFKYFNEQRQEDILVPIHASPAIIADIGLVVASDDGYLRFLDPPLERAYWELQLFANVYASLVVDQMRKRVIVATTKGIVAAFNLKGQIEWQVNLERPVFATPAICAEFDLLSVAAFENMGFGLSLETGEVRFAASLPAPWHASLPSLPAFRNPYASPAMTASGDTVFCSGNHVVSLDRQGEVNWQVDLGAEIKSSPVVHLGQGKVAVATVRGDLVFLGLEDGQEYARHRLDDKVTASGAVSGDHLVIGTARGKVHCFHFATHEQVWTRNFGGPFDYTSFTLSPAGDFVATNTDGNAMGIAASDGSFLWETSQVLGLDDHEPGMNITPVLSQDGRMYCASYRGDLYQFTFIEHGK